MRLSVSIIIIGLLASCNPNTQKSALSETVPDSLSYVFAKDTMLNLDAVSLTVPQGWRFANDDTIPQMTDATMRKRLHNRSGKLIYIEHGLSTWGERYEPYVIPAYRRAGYLKQDMDTSGWLFSDDARLPQLLKQSKYRLSSESISGYPAIVYEPKQVGSGYSGIYIDSVGDVAGNLAQFALYGEHLNSAENAELKKVIRSLSIKPFQ